MDRMAHNYRKILHFYIYKALCKLVLRASVCIHSDWPICQNLCEKCSYQVTSAALQGLRDALTSSLCLEDVIIPLESAT